MTHHLHTRISAVVVTFIAATSLSDALEPDPLAQLETERAALEKRLTEIDALIAKIWTDRGVEFLGMTLADTTPELTKQYRLPQDKPQPLVVRVKDPSYFPPNTAPHDGCALWIIEHPVNGFILQEKTGPRFQPKTVRELVSAIVACTITPEEYRKLSDETRKAALQRADTLHDKPAARERMLAIANLEPSPEDAGKYICRVVYHYPYEKGTMTTHIAMKKEDLDQLRALLKK